MESLISKNLIKKMKKITLLLLATMTVFFIGCTNNSTINDSPAGNSNSITEELKEESNDIDLEQIMTNAKNGIPTVKEIKIYTEDNDPNNSLGKAGYYIEAAAIWDSRSGYSEDYAEEKGKWGTDAGGSIEIYANEKDATNRTEYLGQFSGQSILDPGAFEQVDNIIIRASSNLTKSEQDEIIIFFKEQLN